jgi:hypothetical protein
MHPYRRRWGSLRAACERLAAFHRGEISREELERSVVCGRNPLRASVRWAVLERDGRRCCACGRRAGERGVVLDVDHVVPVARGGGDEISNLRVLCRECNRGKGRAEVRQGESATGGGRGAGLQ